jgi:hypothetical protein
MESSQLAFTRGIFSSRPPVPDSAVGVVRRVGRPAEMPDSDEEVLCLRRRDTQKFSGQVVDEASSIVRAMLW